ncbi:hypothetical protein [Anaerotruncus colihominis]|uniref:hypothetical protein n=1 Tax=Anaerotruncus colihominis TaxID=169435 RepID=UPI0029421E8C|nr:hypothetical protein [Anaerotruncus colihominis]
MMIRYFEVMLDDGYSICIKGVRKPSKEEAAAFLTERDLKGRKVVDVEEWDRKDAETAFDFGREAEWPVFGR